MKCAISGEEMGAILDAIERKRHHTFVGRMQIVGKKINYILFRKNSDSRLMN